MKFPPVISRFVSIEALFCILALAFPALWLMTAGKVKFLTPVLFSLFLLLIPGHREIVRDRLVLFCVIFALILFGEYAWQVRTVPPGLFGRRFPANYFYFCSFFLVLAYGTILWKRINPFFLLIGMILGFLFFLVWHTPYQQWLLSWKGERADFGFRNSQHAGIFFGAALLCISFFGIRLYRSCRSPFRLPAIVVMIIIFLTFVWGVIATQVIAVWLALGASFCSFLVLGMMTGVFHRAVGWLRDRRRVALVLLVVSLCAIVFDRLEVRKIVSSRLEYEGINVETIHRAADFDEQIQLTSTGARIAMWLAARDWIAERPMLGWGVFSAEKLIDADRRFTSQFKEWFGHLHNSYVEVLVATGIVGLTCMLAIVILIYRSAYLTWRAGAMPLDVFLFSWAFLTFWGIVNFFESYINYKTGFYLNSVMFGFIYAFCLHYRTALSTLREKSGMTRPGAQ